MSRPNPPKDALRDRFSKLRGAFIVVGLFSCLVNILMLTGPMFMLQVYDRVLTSQSVPTLLALLALAIGLYAMLGLFDFFRTRVLSRMAAWLDGEIAPLAYRAWMVRSLTGYRPGYKPVQDLTAMRNFMSSPTMLALFDVPWVPIYLGVVFLLHYQLGLLALAGAGFVIVLALFNELMSSFPLSKAAQEDQIEGRFAEQSQTGADSVLAMGMLANTMRTWRGLRGRSMASYQSGTERSEMFAATSKASRLLLQSGILGLAAYLAIQQEISPGMIVAASIIAGRALAPIDQLIGGWKMLKRTRLARSRLRDYLSRDAEAGLPSVTLPEPKGHVSVVNLTKYAPQVGFSEPKAILNGVSFSLQPGDGLGVIGPSASGKSSLARLLVGLWMPDRGAMRLDGATFEQWDRDLIGAHIGYLPQNVQLLSGSIAQNISRFEAEPDQREIVEAAQLAGVHEMILGFPEGYATDVDSAVSPLTGGQTQRIALARAVYRKPRLLVLDEPNSNLDVDGDTALANAIIKMREAGCTVIVMAHRPSAIAAVDQVLMLNEGTVAEYGPKADIIRKLTRSA